MSVTQYDSRKNTMKRSNIAPVYNMAAPTTAAYVGLYVTNLSVPHEVIVPTGSAPAFRYFYEPFGDGVIWPPLSGRLDGNAQNPTNTLIEGPGIVAWADETNIYLQLFATVNTFTGTYPVYLVVYRDFTL